MTLQQRWSTWRRRRLTSDLSPLRVLMRVTLPFVVVCALGFSISVWRQGGDARRDFQAESGAALALYARALAVPLARGNEAAATEVAQRLAADPSVRALIVRDVAGRPLFTHRGAEPLAPQGFMEWVVHQTRVDQRELMVNGATVGSVEVTFHKDGAAHAWRFDPRQLVWMSTAATVLVMGITLWVASRSRRRYRSILERIRETATVVDASTGALREVSASQSSASAEAAAAMSETQAVAAEVGASAAALAERGAQLDAIASRAEAESGQAIEAVTQAREAMTAVQQQSRAIGAAIATYSEKASAVGEIASAVAGLAERSNLLALNAALEASRAGEKGKAFSVVAREMRTLAEATTRAAAQTQALIGEVQGAVERWGAGSDTGERRVAEAERATTAALETLHAFAQSTRALAGLGRELAGAGEDQRSAIGQTVEALRQANDAAAETLEGVRDVETSAERLGAISRALVGALEGRAELLAEQVDDAATAKLRIRAVWRQVLPVLVPLAAFVVLMVAFALPTLPDVEALARRSAEARLVSVATAVSGAQAARDAGTLRAVLGAARGEHGAEYLVLRDAAGEVVGAVGAVPATAGESERGIIRDGAFLLTRALPQAQLRLTAGFDLGPARAVHRRMLVSTAVIAVVILLGGGLLAWWVARTYARVFERLLRVVERAARTLDEQVARLAATTAQQSSAAAESAAALGETRASADEVGRGAATAATRAELLIEGGQGCALDADRAMSATSSATEALVALRDHVSELSRAIAGFGDRAEAIGQVASTVATLAERSELLAVNASIEAARAAHVTAGFAVVAEQMRELADGSARAAAQVKEIVTDVRGALARALEDAREGARRVRAAEGVADAAGQRVVQFADVAREFVRVGNELGAAASKQRSAIDQMVEAIAQASESSAQQTHGTEAVRDVAGRLVELSRGLVETTRSRGVSTPPPPGAPVAADAALHHAA